MKLKEVTYNKEFKLGLPNFSNITVSMQMTFEVLPDEKPDHDYVWDQMNRQLSSQTDLDPTWLKTQDLKDFTKLVLKIPKTK